MVWVGSGSKLLAPCLRALFAEADRLYPNRAKGSDGTLGDAAHSARTSDHNPDDDPGDGVAIAWVCAADLTDDPAGPVAWSLLEHLRTVRDPRVKYGISEGWAFYAYEKPGRPAWTWVPYTGTNGHFQHGHVSVWNTTAARDDLSPWFPTAATAAPVVAQEEDDMPPAPVVVVDRAGRRWRFARGTDGRLWYKLNDEGFRPAAMESNTPGSLGSAVTASLDPRDEVTIWIGGAGPDGQLFECSWNGAVFVDWRALGGRS